MKLYDLILRPQLDIETLASLIPEFGSLIDKTETERRDEIVEAAEIRIKYSGYIEREQMVADRVARLDNVRLRGKLDYENLTQISIEARQKLQRIDPETVGQASQLVISIFCYYC